MVKRKRTSRKRKRVIMEIEKPWCFYCDRSFENEQVLHSHQRARHFTCPHCSRRFALAVSLGMHMYQTHNDPLTTVHNSVPGRGNPKLPISGMNGIPIQFLVERNKQMYTQEKDETFRSEILKKILELGGDLEDLGESSTENQNPMNQSNQMDDITLGDNTSRNQGSETSQGSYFFTKFLSPELKGKPLPSTIYVYKDDELSIEEKRALYHDTKAVNMEDTHEIGTVEG